MCVKIMQKPNDWQSSFGKEKKDELITITGH